MSTLSIIVWFIVVTLVVFYSHLLEEQKWPGGFRPFWNSLWRNGNENFPLTKRGNLTMNVVGLGLIGTVLGILAISHPIYLYVLLGFILADTVQHVVFSLRRDGYTPGVATCVAYTVLLCLGWQIRRSLPYSLTELHTAMVLGALLLIPPYFMVWIKQPVTKIY